MRTYRYNDIDYVNANELATAIGTYPHKLREKAKGMGFRLDTIPDMAAPERGLTLGNAVSLLDSYTHTMKNGKLRQVKLVRAKLSGEVIDIIPPSEIIKMPPPPEKSAEEPQKIPTPINWRDPLLWLADFLRTEKALLVFILALVTVQAAFVRNMFADITTMEPAYSWVYGFGYELTGLTLCLNGSTRWAIRIFAAISGCIILLQVGFLDGIAGATFILKAKKLILAVSLPAMVIAFGERYLTKVSK